MSIKTEIDRIKQSKADIVAVLKTKGITVPADASIDDLSALVDAIEVATDPILQSKTVSPSTSSQTVKPDGGYDGLSQVTVSAVTSSIDSDIKATNIKKGIDILGVTGTLEENEDLSSELSTQDTLITTQETTIDSIISALVSKSTGITPSGTLEITENGTYDVTNYANANVNVAGSGGASVETCDITVKHYPTYNTSYAVSRIRYQTLDDSGNITIKDISYSNGDISYSTNEFVLSNVVCSSIMVVNTGGANAVLTGGTSLMSAYGSHAIQVNGTGVFEFQPTG